MFENLAILSIFVLVYSLVCGGLEKTPLSGATVYTAFGLLMGPMVFNLLRLDATADGIRILAELTLALVLFSDAAHSNLRVLKESIRIPARLLSIGLPLTILLGFGLGRLLFPSLGVLEIAILATILAPTDAALGKAVVSNQAVPPKLREGLNVESGLNDGICVPVLLVFLALSAGLSHGDVPQHIVPKLVLEQLGIGVLVGVSLTGFAVWLIDACTRHRWVTETWRQVPVVALSLGCYSIADVLGGSGFIASFCGGFLFNRVEHHHKHKLLLAAEGSGDLLALVTWVVFGAAVIGFSVDSLSWRVVAYAVLSLTVIRMLPVWGSLIGTELRADEKLFLGWFGPRGLASIVFAVIVLNADLPHGQTISMVVVCTIVLSILLHGLSANPLAAWLIARRR